LQENTFLYSEAKHVWLDEMVKLRQHGDYLMLFYTFVTVIMIKQTSNFPI